MDYSYIPVHSFRTPLLFIQTPIPVLLRPLPLPTHHLQTTRIICPPLCISIGYNNMRARRAPLRQTHNYYYYYGENTSSFPHRIICPSFFRDRAIPNAPTPARTNKDGPPDSSRTHSTLVLMDGEPFQSRIYRCTRRFNQFPVDRSDANQSRFFCPVGARRSTPFSVH